MAGWRAELFETLFQAGRILAESSAPGTAPAPAPITQLAADAPAAFAPGPAAFGPSFGPSSAPVAAPAPGPGMAADMVSAGTGPKAVPIEGPGGPICDVVLCLFPLLFLVIVTLIKPISLPTSISLPIAALLMWAFRLMYFASPANYVNALVVVGFFEALTPLSIIFGAILLFQTMQHTKCLPWMMNQIKSLSGGHPVAEVFLISWAFAYLVEGASGFGTPVALASPMLSELGHNPIKVVTCGLIMNTLATQFGAVGTPIWFGFAGLGLTDSELTKVGFQAALLVGATAYFVPILAASFLVPFRDLARNWLFVVLSISTAVVPSIAISWFNYEFPSLLGGIISLFLTAGLTFFKVGLRPAVRRDDIQDLAYISDSDGADSDDEVLQGNLSLVEGVGLKSFPAKPTMDFPLAIDPRFDHHGAGAMVDAAVECDLDHPHHASGGHGHEGADHPHTRRARSMHSTSRRAHRLASQTKGAGPGQEEEEADQLMQGGARKGAGLQADVKGSLEDEEFTGKAGSGSSEFEMVSPPRKAGKAMDEHESGLLEGHAVQVGDDLEKHPYDPHPAKPKSNIAAAIGRTMPIWLTVVLLLVTRIPQLKIKGILQDTDPAVCLHLGSFGTFCASYSAVFQLKNVLDEPTVAWKYEFLYIPFFLPFTVVSIVTILFYCRSFDKGTHLWAPFVDAAKRIQAAVLPTLGALVLVQLIRQGGPSSPGFVIGYWLSNWMGVYFLMISAYLGALGSFFSGSTTVSNLTFGDIQKVAAESIGKPVTTMLGIQTLGATMGNMICINNIISAKAVMNLNHVGEGVFIARTGLIGLLMGAVGEVIGFGLTYAGFP